MSHSEKQQRVVLLEEEYQDTLEAIVERDYFSELPALRRQAAVLERRAEGDIAGAVAIRRAARQLEQHEETLEEQEQFDEHDYDGAHQTLRKRPRPLHRETLSGFHARVTTEDNEEFDRTQRQEVKENRERLQQVFAANSSLLRIAGEAAIGRQGEVGSETPLLASDKFDAPVHRTQASEWNATDQGTNGLFFSPEHIVSVAGQSDSQQKRLANCTSSDRIGDKQLMPPPAKLTETRGLSSLTTAIAVNQGLVEYTPKHTQEKRIEPSQTRFPAPDVPIPPSPFSMGAGDSSTDYSTEASTDLDEMAPSLSAERRSYAKRQRREQESLVRMTPMIIPGRDAGSESPIVTWGTVSGTPILLGGKAFSMPDESKREIAARQVQTNLENAKRSKMPVRDRVSTLTPAGRALFEKSSSRHLLSSARSRNAFSSALRSSYTGTPRVRSSRPVKRDSVGKATPRLPPAGQATDDTTSSTPSITKRSGSITDGLLKFP